MTVVRDRLYFRGFASAIGWELCGLGLGIEFLHAPVVLWTP